MQCYAFVGSWKQLHEERINIARLHGARCGRLGLRVFAAGQIISTTVLMGRIVCALDKVNRPIRWQFATSCGASDFNIRFTWQVDWLYVAFVIDVLCAKNRWLGAVSNNMRT